MPSPARSPAAAAPAAKEPAKAPSKAAAKVPTRALVKSTNRADKPVKGRPIKPTSKQVTLPLAAEESAELRRCFMLLPLSSFGMTITWQAYMPTFVLFISETLGFPEAVGGWAMGMFTVGSIVGMACSPLLLRLTTARKSMLMMFALRIVSGVTHALACDPRFDRMTSLVMIIIGRILHGISINAYVIAFIYIGAFSHVSRRAHWISMANSVLMIGAVVGPQIGILLARLSPGNPYDAAKAPGWNTAAVTAALWIIFYFGFTDARMLPQQRRGDTSKPSARERLAVVMTCLNQGFGWAGWIAFEATLSYIILNEYGWHPDSDVRVAALWTSMTGASLIFTFVYMCLSKRWSYMQIAALKNVLMLIGGFLMVNWRRLQESVPWTTLLVGLFTLSAGEALTFNLHQTIVSLANAPERQAKYNSLVQVCCQLGRCIGPVVGAAVFGHFELSNEGGSARPANMTMVVQFGLIGFANLLPLFFARSYYGPWTKATQVKAMV